MTITVSTERMTRPLLLIAAIVVASAFALWDTSRGIAAAAGAVLSLANWYALRGLGSRLVYGGLASARGAALSFLLIAKIGALMAVVYILIARVHLDPVGLVFGLSVLFIGPVLAGLLASGQTMNPSAAMTAREER